uniref:cytochrome b n=1 Tax=Discus perspectivus TaxID=697275 RepID=UPI002176D3F5|nr:cytochrome b [Discus perspectivus]UUB71740.1 cytochrome b [Discus perspectivus]
MRKNIVIKNLKELPTPISISIWWNWGSLLGVILVIQLISGFFISLHYTSYLENSFDSVIHLLRDVPGGVYLRALHANGASLFFLMLYTHIGRGLYYQSYALQPQTWLIGVSIYVVCMATAFLGYVLPWGQMSYWGATVITNLISAIPYFGGDMVIWVWGGFAVGQPTLTRFFALHFILPFIIALMSLLHLVFLHEKGSTNPLGDQNHLGKTVFHPYSTWKDLVGFILLLGVLCYLIFFAPNLLIDPENYVAANPMVTPPHIQPEWYFLFAYAILRAIPSKLGGVIALVFSFAFLYLLPWGGIFKAYPGAFNWLHTSFFFVFFSSFVLLTWLGACAIETPYVEMTPWVSLVYFMTPWILMIISGGGPKVLS